MTIEQSGVFASCVRTPIGEEIVPEGWDEEVTIVREIDPLILEVCAGLQRKTQPRLSVPPLIRRKKVI